MSITAMSAARQITDVTPTEKFVLMALADYANDHGVSWPNLNSLRTWTCLGRSTIIRTLGELAERGLVEKMAMVRKDGSQTSNNYRLTFVGSDSDDADRFFAQPKGGVPLRDGGGPAVAPLERLLERPEEPKTLSTTSTPSPKKTVAEEEYQTGFVESLVKVWNEHCGVLPSVKATSPKREQALLRFARVAGGIYDAVEIMERATKAVAQDDFWRKNKYGLDNLLAGDKIFQKAESYEAQEAPTSAGCSLGDTVRFTSVMGRVEEGEVVEITDKQVAIRQSRDGRVVRAPLGSIKEVL